MGREHRYQTGDKTTQGFDTHRCERMPDGASLRRYHDMTKFERRIYGDGWVLGFVEWDPEYDVTCLNSCGKDVMFCPWCGERLP